ncbi:MAG: DUF4197 domain-containing protein [Desulfuromonas sp.]|nr:MAG: DUF4197 domain-containing protein [Desulfuromonas sp.]
MVTKKLSLYRMMIYGLLFVALSGCVESGAPYWQQGAAMLDSMAGQGQALTTTEISQGLREALRVGTATVSSQLGRKDGFNLDSAVHIPLPDKLQQVQETLEKFNLSYLLDDLELKINRAAEAAAPKAKSLFWSAIREMTLSDVMNIYNGPDDAATRYFQQKMTPELARAMRPVISNSLSEVGAIQSYDRAIDKYRQLPFVPDVKADLTGYVTEKGMDGIFHYLALEEKAIRRDPLKRTTELLRRVFGP